MFPKPTACSRSCLRASIDGATGALPMSRHSLQPLPGLGAIYEVAIGWDRALATFFVIVFGAPDDDDDDGFAGGDHSDELSPLLWEGTAPGAFSTPEAAIALAASYATIPDGLAARLARDRLLERSAPGGPAQSAALAPLWPKSKGRQ